MMAIASDDHIYFTGPAAEKQSRRMGDYKLDNAKTAQLRKVYKKTDRDDTYIFYDSKFLL